MYNTDHNLKSVLATVTAILLVLAFTSVNSAAVDASPCSFTVVTVGSEDNVVDAGVTIGGTGTFEISSSAIITGSCGGIHTNGDLKVGGI